MSDQLPLFAARRHAGIVLEHVAVDAGHLARKHDVGGSIAAAAEAVESGRAATEARAVLEAVRRHPGTTRLELALRTADIAQCIGQDPETWRYTCGRRLTTLEDQGAVRAVAPRFSLRRPQRQIDPNIEPCTASGLPSIRWWPKEGA